jgi:hypothetical protein
MGVIDRAGSAAKARGAPQKQKEKERAHSRRLGRDLALLVMLSQVKTLGCAHLSQLALRCPFCYQSNACMLA